MEKLKFSYNWNNKLYCEAFTTIRIAQPNRFVIGQQFEIILNKNSLKRATVVGYKEFFIGQLNEYMSYLDTGYSVDETVAIIVKMYPTVDFLTKKLCFVLFKTF